MAFEVDVSSKSIDVKITKCINVYKYFIYIGALFIFLLAGALPRIFGIFLTEKAIATLQNGRLIIEWIKKDKSIPEGWWDASFSQKPVVVTAVISSLILWILKLAIT